MEEARQLLEEALHSGKALEKFRQMITDQGGDASVIDDPSKILTAKYEVEVPAKTSGVVTKLSRDRGDDVRAGQDQRRRHRPCRGY